MPKICNKCENATFSKLFLGRRENGTIHQKIGGRKRKKIYIEGSSYSENTIMSPVEPITVEQRDMNNSTAWGDCLVELRISNVLLLILG